MGGPDTDLKFGSKGIVNDVSGFVCHSDLHVMSNAMLCMINTSLSLMLTNK